MPGENLTRDEARERASVGATASYDVTLDLSRSPKTFASRTRSPFSATPGAGTFVDLIAGSCTRSSSTVAHWTLPRSFADSRIALDGLAERNELRVVADCALHEHRRGPAPVRRPGRRRGLPLQPVRGRRLPPRCSPVFEQPDLKAHVRVHGDGTGRTGRSSPTPRAPTPGPVDRSADGGADRRRTWAFDADAAPLLVHHRDRRRAVPRRARHADQRRRAHDPARRLLPRGRSRSTSTPTTSSTSPSAGFAFYEEEFDLPYPFAKYDQLFVPEFNAGAMENAGAVTFLENYVFRSKVPEATVERRAVTILHELAHMWFGDLVTMRWWDDLWLNESFAEYASTLATAEATRWTERVDHVRLAGEVVGLPAGPAALHAPDRRRHPRPARTSRSTSTASPTPRAPRVLKQLVAYVGQDAFLAGVRRYFAQARVGQHRAARPARASSRSPTGATCRPGRRLWLEKAGVTLLRPEIDADADGLDHPFAVLQEVPDDAPRAAPAPPGDRRVRRAATVALVRTCASSSTSTARAPGARARRPSARPTCCSSTTTTSPTPRSASTTHSLATAIAHLRRFDDSLPRSLVWAAAWDMTRDARDGRRRDFVDLVLGNIDARDGLLRGPRPAAPARYHALDLYVAPEHRERPRRSRPATACSPSPRPRPAGRTHSCSSSRRSPRAPPRGPARRRRRDCSTASGSSTASRRHRPALGAAGLARGGRSRGRDGDRRPSCPRTRPRPVSARPPAARAAIPTPEAKAARVGRRGRRRRAAERVAGRDHRRLRPGARPRRCSSRLSSRTSTRSRRSGRTAPTRWRRTSSWASTRPTWPTTTGWTSSVRTDAWLAEHEDAAPALRRLVLESRDGVRRTLAAQAARPPARLQREASVPQLRRSSRAGRRATGEPAR